MSEHVLLSAPLPQMELCWPRARPLPQYPCSCQLWSHSQICTRWSQLAGMLRAAASPPAHTTPDVLMPAFTPDHLHPSVPILTPALAPQAELLRSPRSPLEDITAARSNTAEFTFNLATGQASKRDLAPSIQAEYPKIPKHLQGSPTALSCCGMQPVAGVTAAQHVWGIQGWSLTAVPVGIFQTRGL